MTAVVTYAIVNRQPLGSAFPFELTAEPDESIMSCLIHKICLLPLILICFQLNVAFIYIKVKRFFEKNKKIISLPLRQFLSAELDKA
jgi:hypothetical protein